MEKGTWYLTYRDFDNSENHINNALRETREKLEGNEEVDIVGKAQLRWNEISAKSKYEGWDKQMYPNTPVVIYEIPL